MKSALYALLILLSVAASAEPSVRMEADKNSGCAPLVVNFLSVSEIPDGQWKWDFSNGFVSNQKTPSVVFMEPGVYKVKLVVSNGSTIDSVQTTINVFAAPKADFEIEKPSLCSNEILNFRNHSSAGDAPISNYVWAFGDGKTSTDMHTAHRYKQGGNYTATLVITDENGCSSSKVSIPSIEVKDAPRASFEANPASSCSSTQQVFFPTSQEVTSKAASGSSAMAPQAPRATPHISLPKASAM